MKSEMGVPAPDQRLVSRADFTEADYFVLEAAEQLGFVATDDESTRYVCSDESIVELARRIQKAALK